MPGTRHGDAPGVVVGRGGEAAVLGRCLEEAVGGSPRLVLLSGEAGIGKTRLIEEFEASAAAKQVWRCRGRGYAGLRLPYQLFVEILQDQLADVPEAVERVLGSDAERINGVVGADETLPELRLPDEAVEHHVGRQGLFVAVSRATIELARVRPTLLLLDDLHWADEASLQQLTHLVFSVGEAVRRAPVPLLIVAAHRPPEPDDQRLNEALTRLRRESICSTLEVSELDEDDLGELITSLGLAKPARQLVTGLHAMTGGNPFFAAELVGQLLHRNLLREQGGYQTTAKPLDELDLPASLDGAIRARTAQVDKRCAELLCLASCLGNRIPLAALGSLSGLPETEMLELLEKAWRHELLVSSDDSFEFRHPMIRQDFYTAMSGPRRERTHLRIAQHLEGQAGGPRTGDVIEIARHLDRAGSAADPEKLAEFAGAAGDVAVRRLAWADAARSYETALGVYERLGRLDPGERATLQFRAGLAHYRNMDTGPCRDRLDQALQGFTRANDASGVAKVLVERMRARLTMGEAGLGDVIDTAPLEKARDDLPAGERVIRSSVTTMLSEAYRTAGRADEAERSAREALELAREADDEGLYAQAWVALGMAQMHDNRPREARESLEEALVCARRTGDPWVEGWPLQRAPLAHICLGNLGRAEEGANLACSNSQVTGDWAEYSLGLAALTQIAVARGRFDEAEELTLRTLAMARRSNYPWGAAVALPALASGRAQLGDRAGAEEVLQGLTEPGGVANASPALGFLVQVFRQLLAARAGTLDPRAEPLTIGLLLRQPTTDFTVLPLLCAGIETACRVGDEDLAARCYERLAPAAEGGTTFTVGWVYLLPRMLGLAAARQGRFELAEDHFREASRAATQAGAHPELARVCLDQARMLMARDRGEDHGRAVERVRRAAPLLDELGMEGGADEAIQLATALGIRLYESTGPSLSTRTAPPTATTPEAAAPLALLITDMESFTPLVERLGDARAQDVIHAHNVILRACLRAYRGREIQHTGDGLIAAFSSLPGAVDCAVAIQRDLAHYGEQRPEDAIRVRIGLHAGSARPEENRLFGAVVNATSRICARAEPSQILVSETIRASIDEERFALADRGRVPLKGFREPFQLYEVEWRG